MKLKNFNQFIKESLNNSLAMEIQKKGARQVAMDLIDKHLGFVDASDLPDSITYADGIDTIEELLNSGQYDAANEEARNTASAMLEEEGFDGMFDYDFESVKNVFEGKEHKFADKLEDMATKSEYLTQDEKDDFEAPIYTKIGMWAMSIFDKLKLKDKDITDEDYKKAFGMVEDKLKNRKPSKEKKNKDEDSDDE